VRWVWAFLLLLLLGGCASHFRWDYEGKGDVSLHVVVDEPAADGD